MIKSLESLSVLTPKKLKEISEIIANDIILDFENHKAYKRNVSDEDEAFLVDTVIDILVNNLKLLPTHQNVVDFLRVVHDIYNPKNRNVNLKNYLNRLNENEKYIFGLIIADATQAKNKGE